MYTADSLLTIRAHSQTEQLYLEASINKPDEQTCKLWRIYQLYMSVYWIYDTDRNNQ